MVLLENEKATLEMTSRRAIQDAEIPPIPKDLIPLIEGGRIEVNFTFTFASSD